MPSTTLSEGRGRPTMRDVAALAGVSLKTVSRVVNDEPGVAPAVRERVARAVRGLGYRPNPAASALRRAGAHTGLLGVVVPDVSGPRSAAVLRAATAAGREAGAGVVLASAEGDAALEQRLVLDLVARGVDVLLVAPTSERQAHLRHEVPGDTTLVVAGRAPRGLEADTVTLDDAGAARTAAEHLLAHGHRRVAGVFSDEPASVTQRLRAGLVTGLEGSTRSTPLVVSPGTATEASATAHELLDGTRPPSALVVSGEAATTGTLAALRERTDGHDIALVALEPLPRAGDTEPPLTTVGHDLDRFAVLLTEVVRMRLSGDATPRQHVTLRPTLVPRGSGERARRRG